MLLFAVILAKYYRPGPPAATPGASSVPVSAPQESTTPSPGSTTGQTNGNGSTLPMNADSEMTEPETPVENTADTEINTNEASDSNQAGN
jgi:hypothetical protein